ncbi:MAG TPA: fused MFS/spermidine synthase, partial [Methylomirabilota bacterium]|nr:fused MFS/spermidine synthase [Methylomirabilota bacterium]
TTFAVATVLASFMGGLALGSWWMGRVADRFRHVHPLRLYAALEAILAGVAILVPVMLRLQAPLYRALSSALLESYAALSLLRLVLCAIVLLVPTFLMGATLPALSRVTERPGASGEAGGPGAERATAGRWIGLLYASNTLGAVLGCAAAGLWLLPALGLMRTQWLAVVLNLAAAAGALLLAPRFRIAGTVAAVGGTAVPGVTVPPPDRIGSAGAGAPVRVLPIRATPAERLLVAAYAVSGFTAMLYEVAWSRLLVLVLGSSTYSYTIMLATFLLGLAAGAWIGVRLLKTARDALLAVGLCQILVALTTWLSLFLVEELPYAYLLAHDHLQPSARGLLVVQWALAAALMLPPTLGLGAMFPVTVGGLAPQGGRAPRVVGWAYAWNTLGAIGGSIVAGFWLVPGPGTRITLLAGIALNTLVAIVAVARGARSGAA